MSALHHGKETTSRNVSGAHFIIISCFTSGIYRLLSKTISHVFSFMYFLLEQYITRSFKDMHTLSSQCDDRKHHSCTHTPTIIAI